MFRQWPTIAWTWIKSKFIVDVTITDKDPAFEWVRDWMADQPFTKKTRNLDVALSKSNYDEFPSAVIDAPSGNNRRKSRLRFILSPGMGTHFFTFKRTLVWMTRAKENNGTGGTPSNNAVTREIITLRFFSRNRQVAADLLNEVIEHAQPEKDPCINIYTCVYGGWRLVGTRKLKFSKNVILPKGQYESLCVDLEKFTTSRDWYQHAGVAYRRSYMFYGPSGTGKSSTALSMAMTADMDLAILPVGDIDNDSQLARAISERPDHSILLLEDIDCMFKKRSSTDSNIGSEISSRGVSLSGLLNVLDGAASSEGTITIMTTNHIENLDEALIRPGRCDYKIEYSHAEEDQAARMLLHFFSLATADQVAQFAGIFKDKKISMCRIQEHLLRNRDSVESAVSTAAEAFANTEIKTP